MMNYSSAGMNVNAASREITVISASLGRLHGARYDRCPPGRLPPRRQTCDRGCDSTPLGFARRVFRKYGLKFLAKLFELARFERPPGFLENRYGLLQSSAIGLERAAMYQRTEGDAPAFGLFSIKKRENDISFMRHPQRNLLRHFYDVFPEIDLPAFAIGLDHGISMVTAARVCCGLGSYRFASYFRS